jgi:hypothetical protein
VPIYCGNPDISADAARFTRCLGRHAIKSPLDLRTSGPRRAARHLADSLGDALLAIHQSVQVVSTWPECDFGKRTLVSNQPARRVILSFQEFPGDTSTEKLCEQGFCLASDGNADG